MNMRLSAVVAVGLLAVAACSSNPNTPQLAMASDEVVHGAVPAKPGTLDSDNEPKYLHSGINSTVNSGAMPGSIYQ